jgi:glycosyltransferase involved in cell wall biosynthesis
MTVACLVPAHNESARIAATVAALREVSVIDEIIVIDDGSTDDTAAIARAAGARVHVLARNLGKGGALRAGLDATAADVLALIDADLGDTAAVAAALLHPVQRGEADMTIARPPDGAPSGFGLVEGFARWGINALTHARMQRPLSGQRALTREIATRFGFASGFGVEVALTVDALRAGYRVIEIPAPIEHNRTGRDVAGFLHRGRQGMDVAVVLARRAFTSGAHRRGRQTT